MKAKSVMLILMLFAGQSFQLQANTNREYLPIVISGEQLSLFFNHDVTNLYLYSYDAAAATWHLLPFQIDEVNSQVDDSIKYFVADDNLLDADDELVFMAADLGDKAASDIWVEAADTARLELAFFDPLNNSTRYAYLFYSESSDLPIPDTYQMAYDAQTDRVSSVNYEVGFNNTGQLSDVLIKPGIGGSGMDLFDRIKLRLALNFLAIVFAANEDSLVAFNAYAKTGPVRVIRNMAGSFRYRMLLYSFDEPFIQTSFFYPWNGEFTLVDIPIGDLKTIGLGILEFRLSWDFNQQATGMNFFSENNRGGVLIDGNFEKINNSCVIDDLNWTMGTGDQGTLLNIFYVPPYGDLKQLYYYEALDNTTGDSLKRDFLGPLYDTGDHQSYGDNGYSMIYNIQNYIDAETNFNFLFYNFFLPENFLADNAAAVCEQMKQPLEFAATVEYYSGGTRVVDDRQMKPDKFYLVQNYPNPFNSATTIIFNLAAETLVNLNIYDSMGRLVTTLAAQKLRAGEHRFIWDGKDNQGNLLASGLYFCRLQSENYSGIRKLMMIK